MKVYSWKTLLLTIIIGIGGIICHIFNYEGFSDLIWIGIFGYYTANGLYSSFTEKGHEALLQRQQEAKELKQYLVDEYGKIYLLLRYSPIIFFVCSIIFTLIKPYVDWAINAAFITNLLFMFFVIMNVKVIDNHKS